jgi:hypothetical protein
MSTRQKAILLMMMILCLTQFGQATVIKIGLIGQIDSVDDPYDLLEGAVQQNDPITGYYIYDSETPDTGLSIYGGLYEYDSAPYGMLLTAGNITFQTDPANVDFVITTSNNYYGESYDEFNVKSYNNLDLDSGITVDSLHFQLHDYSGTALSSDALPAGPPDLLDWQTKSLRISGGRYPFPSPLEKTLFQINSHVTSVYLIPEPGTLLLFMMGMVAISRKKSKTY